VTTGRKAYPGSPLDQIVGRGIGTDLGSGALTEVVVDGKRLGEIADSLRTPKPMEVRPETKYREIFAAAVATVRLGLTGVEIETRYPDGTKRERPDLLLRHDGREFGVGVARVEPTHHEHDVLMGIERAVLEAVTADESLKPRGMVVRFEITAAAVSGLSTTDRVALQNDWLVS